MILLHSVYDEHTNQKPWSVDGRLGFLAKPLSFVHNNICHVSKQHFHTDHHNIIYNR